MFLKLDFSNYSSMKILSDHQSQEAKMTDDQLHAGLSHPFLGMGPGPLELGKLAVF